MLVPEFYFRGWGWGKSCLGSPPGPLVADGVKQGTRTGAWAKGRGVGWLCERPRLKVCVPPQLWALWHPTARPRVVR